MNPHPPFDWRTMTTPSAVPPVTAAPQLQTPPVDTAVLETAVKVQKFRTFARNTASKVGLPVLIGSVSAAVTSVVITRRNSGDENYDVVIDTDTE